MQKFKQHIAEEIRYLALASTVPQTLKIQPSKLTNFGRLSESQCYHTITEDQASKKSGSAVDLYYLFERGKPLSLQTPVTNVPVGRQYSLSIAIKFDRF